MSNVHMGNAMQKVNCGLCHCILFHKSKSKLNLIELIGTVNGFTAWICTWFELTDFQIEILFFSLSICCHMNSMVYNTVLYDKNKHRNVQYAYDICTTFNQRRKLTFIWTNFNKKKQLFRMRCWKVEKNINSFGFYFDFRYFGDIMNWMAPHQK